MSPSAARSLRRAGAALLLCLLLPLAGATAAASAEVPAQPASGALPDGVNSPIADEAAHLLWWGEFDRLEALYRSLRQSTERARDGTLRLQWFRVGLARVFNNDATDPYFAQLEALTHDWATQHPESALAQLLYARALHARAISFRGGDYYDKVPQAARREFEHYLALEVEQLNGHAELLKNESTADVYLLMAARYDGWAFAAQHALALDALARNPGDDGGFTELALASLPKWGGSSAQFDAVAREAVRVRKGAGMAMYAYIYDDNANGFNGGLFEASDVDWPTMRQGFRDWLARWPGEYMLNRFALQACHAQDMPTTRELLARIGDKPLDRAWHNDYAACRRWADAN
ncbi:MAG TPA: hypothetical protein VIP05_08865 [Burkholderiaceae bacterium]